MQETIPTSDAPDRETASLKIPPHSIESEMAVLGGILIDETAWEKLSERVFAEDFYRKDHRIIFEAISALDAEGQPIDVVTVAEWLDNHQKLDEAGGLSYIAALAENTSSSSNILAYADIVRKRSVLRQLIRATNNINNTVFNPQGRNSDQILDYAEQVVFEIAEQEAKGRSKYRSIKDLLVDALDRVDELFNLDNPITGVATGFEDLDERTGGFQKSDLVIIAGRPSMGKTSLAINIAEHAAIKNKLSVAVFSMEMPGEQLAMRMMSSLSRIDQHKVRTGKLHDDDWPRLTSAVEILKDAKLFIDDTPALTPAELRSRCRRISREHGLDFIIIDYMQLMQVPGTVENRATEISEISRSLKAMAKELNVPVVALSQLNRSLEQRPNKRPVMSDLRECVTGDTLVTLADGRRLPIHKLLDETPEVLAINDEGRLQTATAEKIWRVGKKPVFDLHLASGRRIRATAKHRLYTIDGWRQLQELAVGDRLAIARSLPEPPHPDELPDERLVLLGHLIADGSYLSGQPLRYTTASEENSSIVRQAAIAQFGVTVNRHEYRGTWHQLVFSGNGNRWHPAGINKWLRELGVFGQRSHEKRVPEAVFRLSNRQIALLLQHLWASDGTIYTRKPGVRGGNTIHFSTNSRGLAGDVAALLLRLGIVARIQAVQSGHYRRTYMVHVTGSAQQLQFLELVGAFGPRRAQADLLARRLATISENPNVDTIPNAVFDQVRMSMKVAGISHRDMAALRGTAYGGSAHFRFSPSRSVLGQYAELLDNDELRQLSTNDLFWDRIVAIEPAGEKEVYDLTVPGPASWLADSIVSHNSGAIEQDADVIIFIYRDEVYNEETLDKGKAEIIISKQRNGPIGTILLTFLGQYTRFENFIEEKPHMLGHYE